MSHSHANKKPDEIQELKHDAWPGFRSAFYLVFGVGLFWLFYIFSTYSGGH